MIKSSNQKILLDATYPILYVTFVTITTTLVAMQVSNRGFHEFESCHNFITATLIVCGLKRKYNVCTVSGRKHKESGISFARHE